MLQKKRTLFMGNGRLQIRFFEWRVEQSQQKQPSMQTQTIFRYGFFPPPSTESNSCEVCQRLISLFLLVFTTWPRNWLTHIFLLAVKLLYLLAALAGMPENSNTCRPSGYASFYLRAVYVCASVWDCSLKNTCATAGYWIFQTRKAGGTSTGH